MCQQTHRDPPEQVSLCRVLESDGDGVERAVGWEGVRKMGQWWVGRRAVLAQEGVGSATAHAESQPPFTSLGQRRLAPAILLMQVQVDP